MDNYLSEITPELSLAGWCLVCRLPMIACRKPINTEGELGQTIHSPALEDCDFVLGCGNIVFCIRVRQYCVLN